jgi:hypothetical protein
MALKPTDDIVIDFKLFKQSIELWMDDLREILAYIHPNDAHDKVYSHRLYELFLRAATEFESIAKAYLFHSSGKSTQHQSTIKDFKEALQKLGFIDLEVGFSLWQPTKKYIRPFQAWSSNGNTLPWYSDYNAVKHSRLEEFSRASLINTLTAGAAAFATLNHCFGVDLWPSTGSSSSGSSTLHESKFGTFPFTLRSQLN